MSNYSTASSRNDCHGSSGRDEEEPLLNSPNDIENSRDGTASFFATFGIIWTIISLQAFIRWISSPIEFRPAPIIGPDEMETWRLVRLRIYSKPLVWQFLLFIYGSSSSFLYFHDFEISVKPKRKVIFLSMVAMSSEA